MMKRALVLSQIAYLMLAIPAIADTSLPPPSAYWKFDETAGNSAYDSSAKINNLEGSNNISWTAGKIKSALSLNGRNGFLKNSTTTNTSLSDSFSFLVWLNPDILPTQSATFASSTLVDRPSQYFAIFAKGALGKQGLEINFKNNYLNITRLDQNEDITSTASFENSHWQQAGIVWDKNKKTLSFYKDGSLTDSVELPKSFTGGAKEDGMTIGTSVSAEDRMFSGYLDEARFYNQVLTAEEIKELYKKDSPPPFASGNSMIANIISRFSQLALLLQNGVETVLRYLFIVK